MTSYKTWVDSAGCRDFPPGTFDVSNVAEAKMICSYCPVAMLCRERVDRLETRVGMFWEYSEVYACETPKERHLRRLESLPTVLEAAA